MAKNKHISVFDAAFKAQDELTKSAPLKTATQKAATKSKLLRTVPEELLDAHAALKASGKTTVDCSSYIVEAFRAQLKKDGAL